MLDTLQPTQSVYSMTTAQLLEVIQEELAKTENTAQSLKERILPVLLEQSLNGEISERSSAPLQSALNKGLTTILERIQTLNKQLIDTREQVTL